MMKKFNIFTLLIGVASAALVSCSEQSDEITSYLLNRNLSPIDLEATSVQETSAKISWAASANATSYNLQIFAEDSCSYNMSGTPEKTLTGISIDEIPVAIDGLLFDTKYTVYVQAVTEGDDSRTSKWNGAYFKTSAKQFLKSLKPADIADRSVRLTWETEEGYDVTTAVVGNVTHTITAEEKEAGSCIVEGLNPETTYTAYLYYNGKQCGNRNFTTIADLNGAVLVREGEDLKDAIEGAEEGATIAVYGGTYELNPNDGKTGAVKVTKTLTIKGIYPTDRPVIKGRFELNNGAGLTISQVVIDGTANSTTDQIFNYKTANVTYEPLTVENAEILGGAKCKGLLYGNVTAEIESITFNECIIHDIECDGGDFFDIRKSYAKVVNFTKSTLYNIAQKRDFIRYDDASGDYTNAAPVINVDQCTINNVLNESSAKRLLYVRFAGNEINWTNNLVTNTKAVYSNQAKTSTPTFKNNYYYGCSNANIFDASDPDNKIYWCGDAGAKNGDNPKYKDAAKGDFTIGNETVSKLKVGDPRWY